MKDLLEQRKFELARRECTIRFGIGVVQHITEMCVDVYELPGRIYRPDLSVAFKNT